MKALNNTYRKQWYPTFPTKMPKLSKSLHWPKRGATSPDYKECVKDMRYSNRDQAVRFAYVTSLQLETHILRNPKTLPASELRQRATKYCRWEVMFVVWTVFASLPATPLIPLPIISNGRRTHRFDPDYYT
jgi:hypothetical protein